MVKVREGCVTWCWAFVVWVWVSASKFLCLFWRKTHTKGLRAIFPTRPKEDERRKVPELRTEKEAKQRSGDNRAVSRRLLGCVVSDAGLANVRRWVSIPGDFVGISLEYTHAIACRCSESCTKVSQTPPFLCLELTQDHDCLSFFSFTFSLVYVVFCMSIKKCEIPLAGDDRNH